MSKKTKRIKKRHYKKHRTNKKKYTRRKSYKKRRDILILPGSKGVPLFMAPEKIPSQSILVNQYRQSGNMIPGLRNM
jgi:hypothetical protein